MERDLLKTDFMIDYRMAVRIFATANRNRYKESMRFYKELNLKPSDPLFSILWLVLMLGAFFAPIMLLPKDGNSLALAFILLGLMWFITPVWIVRQFGFTAKQEYKDYIAKHYPKN